MRRKKLTKSLAALLAVVLVMFMLPMSAFAADETNAAQAVYLDGKNGDDAKSGADSANAVKTLAQAIQLVSDDGIIYICGQVDITTDFIIRGVTFQRAEGYAGIMLNLAGEQDAPITVTMEDVIIDGNKENVPVSNMLVNVEYDANLIIKDGTVLRNNGETALRASYGSGTNRKPGHIVMEGGLITGNTASDYAGGIHNQGNLEITGGVISENWGSYGGGICNESGTITFSGGEIKDNEAYNGAGISMLYGTLTMEGTASITGNVSSYNGSGVYIDNGSTMGDSVFEMKGGTISGNTTGNGYVGSGIFGYCLDFGSRNVIIRISGGTIETESGDSRVIALYSERSANPDLVYPSLELSGSPDIRGSIFLWDGAYGPGYQVNVTGEFEPASPIVIERQNTATDIAAVNYAAGVIPDANDFAAYRLTDILVADGQTIEWREGKIVYFYDADGTEYRDYRHGVITGGEIDTANVPAVQKDGYTFLGWIAKGGTEYWDFDTDTVTDTTELYAAWSLNAPTVTITADNTAVHEGASATLTAEPAHDAANVTYTYQWYKDGSAIAGATQSTFTAMESGSYTVKVTAADGTNTSAEVESNTVEITVENHEFGTSWKSDADNHWHECSVCEGKTDIAAHTFAWVTDREATADEAGSRHEECTVCGYKKAAEEIPATGTPSDTDLADGTQTGGTTAPKTGDDSNIVLWIAVMLAAGAVLTGTVLYSRRKKYSK